MWSWSNSIKSPLFAATAFPSASVASSVPILISSKNGKAGKPEAGANIIGITILETEDIIKEGEEVDLQIKCYIFTGLIKKCHTHVC